MVSFTEGIAYVLRWDLLSFVPCSVVSFVMCAIIIILYMLYPGTRVHPNQILINHA